MVARLFGAPLRLRAEFDGIIIHPMRSEKQVIFLEAKNRTEFLEAYATPEEFMKAMQELSNA